MPLGISEKHTEGYAQGPQVLLIRGTDRSHPLHPKCASCVGKIATP